MKLEKRLEHFLKYVDEHTYWKEDNDVPNHVIVRAYMQKFKPTETNTVLAPSGPIEDRIKYLAQAEREEIIALDNLEVASLERKAKWSLINELGARKNELQFILKEIQAACTTAKRGSAEDQVPSPKAD